MKNHKNTFGSRDAQNGIRTLALLVVTAISTLFTATGQAADAARGEKLSQTCLGCHGAPGLRNPGPVYNIPMVGGQHAEYIISSLQAYKSKERSHGTMQAQAANLTDEAMADIAAFFSAMEGNSRPSRVDENLAKQGQEKSAVCAACHGATGDGDNTTYPKLAGQYQSYLAQSLKDYRSGDRKNAIMAGFAATLTIGDIEALSAWFASQQGGLSAPQSKIFK
ncbi:MAG: cytochrome c4 [Gammaproteobacteria bacterium]|nr:cytochrome c4 [Gammaproteobacteria bacterium]